MCGSRHDFESFVTAPLACNLFTHTKLHILRTQPQLSTQTMNSMKLENLIPLPLEFNEYAEATLDILGEEARMTPSKLLKYKPVVFFFFSFISLIADGPHRYHPACGHKGSSHLSPVHALQFFYRDASSALLQLVNQWLNFTYSRSHAFRYERKNTNPTLVRIELTTSVLADVQLTY